MSVKLYRTKNGAVLEVDGRHYGLADLDFDEVFRHTEPAEWLRDEVEGLAPLPGGPAADELLPPIGSQEVWAAGVTYFRSREARMEESAGAGGGDFYDRVYSADRPELFFKATRHRVAGHGQPVRIRRDARWNVPEPELAVCVSATGRIFGYTIGNDMSSRDIEGENPLYLPQAKVYDGCCALGPGILLATDPLPEETEIALRITRGTTEMFSGSTRLANMKRKPPELVDYLYREDSFPAGCLLLSGTGVVPSNDFTLELGDVVRMSIEPIGVLENTVA